MPQLRLAFIIFPSITMTTILGLSIFAGQIYGIIILCGGCKDTPQWVKYIVAAMQVLMVLAFIGATEGSN